MKVFSFQCSILSPSKSIFTYSSSILQVFFTYCILFSSFSFAQNQSSFLQEIQAQGINTSTISQSNAISRFDTVRLLNSVECIDCLNPPQWMRERYTAQWLQNFIIYPSNNFDDLSHPVTRYKSLNYYYCAAYAADQGYVHGYPRASSSYCPGRFCGTTNTTMQEFIQIIFNISAKYSTQSYNVNWKQIQQRTTRFPTHTELSKVFNLDDLATIKTSAETNESAQGITQNQLTAYAKYCTYNLSVCNFIAFSGAAQGTWPVAELNILTREGILTHTQANQLSTVITKLAPGRQIIEIFEKINNKASCEFDDDYDDDGIKNKDDNCPYVFNPSQIDTDGGGVGDVCDCDIDNDTVVNGFNAVDDLGNVIAANLHNTTKCTDEADDDDDGDFDVKDPTDNCLFVPNTSQEDLNNNGIGDACEDPNLLGLWVGHNTVCAIAPATVDFSCTYTGAIGQINWIFGDGGLGNGCTVRHTFREAGQYVIKAQANSGTSASTTLKVIGDQGLYGMSLTTTGLIRSPGEYFIIQPITIGGIETIEYISTLGHISQKNNQPVTFKAPTAGNYSITAKAYRQGQLVAASQLVVGVQNQTQRTVSAQIIPATLSIATSTPLRLTTSIQGITSNNITSITWDFGDGSTIVNTDLSLTKIYLTKGTKVITQTITLDDNTTIVTMTTINVGGPNDQCIASFMSAKPLIQLVGKPVAYTINLLNFSSDRISKIICDYGDGNIKTFRSNIQQNLTQQHTYLQAGLYTAQCTLTLNDGLILPNSATVTVVGRDRCWDASQYKCDMDNDGTPDICDEDIDGDGVNNLMNLILYEKPGCEIDEENTNLPLKEYEHQLAASGVNIDNCPFNPNADQKDTNGDGYGDECQTDQEYCVLFNGVRYPGPCPVVRPEVPGISTITVRTCTSCPCHYVQAPGDTVRSALFNIQDIFLQVTGTILQLK